MKSRKGLIVRLIALTFFVFCIVLIQGCSAVDSGKYLTLVNIDRNCYEVDRQDWVIKSKEFSFGKYRPPVYGLKLQNKKEILIYPVLVSRRSFFGLAFLPVIPASESLCVPVEKNLLKFIYSGAPEDIRIEMVDNPTVDLQAVKKTEIVGGTMFSFQLDQTLTADGKLIVMLFCGNEQKTLEFTAKRVTSFVPFFIPL